MLANGRMILQKILFDSSDNICLFVSKIPPKKPVAGRQNEKNAIKLQTYRDNRSYRPLTDS